MPKPKTPDAEQLKKEWAELARKIEEITGEKPAQEPQKPVCANCKWKYNNEFSIPAYWLCTHEKLGEESKTYEPVGGTTTYRYKYCQSVNKGDCKGFEPLPPKRTWKQWFRWLSGV